MAVGIAHFGALLERERDDVGERLGQAGAQAAHVGRGLVRDLLQQDGHRLGGMRQRTGQQPEQHHAERVQVGAAVDAAPRELLRRHERRRAQHHAGPRAARVGDAGDAEVGHLHAVVARIDHHVGRLDVAVHHALAVRIGERVRHARDDAQRHRHRQQLRRAGVALQVVALQVLHRDVGEVLVFAGIEDRHDVAVLQPPRRLGLAEKTRARLGELGAIELLAQRHRLDRHLPADLRIVAEVDGAHRATAELPVDAVAAERRSVRRQCRGGRLGGRGRHRGLGRRLRRHALRQRHRAHRAAAPRAQADVAEQQREGRGPGRPPEDIGEQQRPSGQQQREPQGGAAQGGGALAQRGHQGAEVQQHPEQREHGRDRRHRGLPQRAGEAAGEDEDERVRCGHARGR